MLKRENQIKQIACEMRSHFLDSPEAKERILLTKTEYCGQSYRLRYLGRYYLHFSSWGGKGDFAVLTLLKWRSQTDE